MQFKEEECEAIIKSCWDSGENNAVMNKVNTVRENLQKWHKEKFGELCGKIQSLNKSLKEAQHCIPYDVNLRRKAELKDEINVLPDKEET